MSITLHPQGPTHYPFPAVRGRSSLSDLWGHNTMLEKMGNEERVPKTKGVTVELLSTLDLSAEIPGITGYQFRMRKVTIEPGGVFGPLHDHIGRPGMVYVLQGTITDHRNGIATEYGPGPGWPEDRNTLHWLENRGAVPAVEVSVDIVKLQHA